MAVQYLISIVIFALFVLSVLTRAAMLRRQGIHAIVFGVTHKTDFIIIPCALALIYLVIAPAFGWPVFSILVQRFWTSDIPGWAGLAVSITALLFFVYTLVCFGTSFRVGIDESKPSPLVTNGAFAISRNPIYVCFILFFAGLFLVYCNIVTAVILLAIIPLVHRQILREERFLTDFYGDEYREYHKKVRRYL